MGALHHLLPMLERQARLVADTLRTERRSQAAYLRSLAKAVEDRVYSKADVVGLLEAIADVTAQGRGPKGK